MNFNFFFNFFLFLFFFLFFFLSCATTSHRDKDDPFNLNGYKDYEKNKENQAIINVDHDADPDKGEITSIADILKEEKKKHSIRPHEAYKQKIKETFIDKIPIIDEKSGEWMYTNRLTKYIVHQGIRTFESNTISNFKQKLFNDKNLNKKDKNLNKKDVHDEDGDIDINDIDVHDKDDKEDEDGDIDVDDIDVHVKDEICIEEEKKNKEEDEKRKEILNYWLGLKKDKKKKKTYSKQKFICDLWMKYDEDLESEDVDEDEDEDEDEDDENENETSPDMVILNPDFPQKIKKKKIKKKKNKKKKNKKKKIKKKKINKNYNDENAGFLNDDNNNIMNIDLNLYNDIDFNLNDENQIKEIVKILNKKINDNRNLLFINEIDELFKKILNLKIISITTNKSTFTLENINKNFKTKIFQLMIDHNEKLINYIEEILNIKILINDKNIMNIEQLMIEYFDDKIPENKKILNVISIFLSSNFCFKCGKKKFANISWLNIQKNLKHKC